MAGETDTVSSTDHLTVLPDVSGPRRGSPKRILASDLSESLKAIPGGAGTTALPGLTVGSETAGFVSSGTGATEAVAVAANEVQVAKFTQKGAVLLSITSTARDALTSVTAGSMIYNTTTQKLNFYNGSAWEAVTSA